MIGQQKLNTGTLEELMVEIAAMIHCIDLACIYVFKATIVFPILRRNEIHVDLG